MAVDLCVVSFNNGKELPRLIDNLSGGFSGCLFIADNDSSDGTKEALRDIPWPELFTMNPTIVFNENIGYARACNQLAAIGTNDIIGFLNADVWLTGMDVDMIEAAFDKDPTISILGPKQRNEQGYITHAGIAGTNTTARPRAWKEFDPLDRLYRNQEEMVSIAGSAYFIRRSVWDYLSKCETYRKTYPSAVGAMLETDLYYEETFLSYHARHHGFKVVYDGRISIGHSWHASSPIGSQVHKFKVSQETFREACDFHGILHD